MANRSPWWAWSKRASRRVPACWLTACWLAACVALVAGCGDEGDAPFPGDAPDALGPHAVGHASSTWTDEARGGRSLLVDVWYPADEDAAAGAEPASYPLLGPLGIASTVARSAAPPAAGEPRPLLVFSHGYGGIHVQSFGLMEALASHGFVVAAVEHTGNAQSSPDDTFDEAAANRVPDVSFVIDGMLARAADPADPLHGTIDPGAVGVLGHSFGGMTAVGVAAGWAGAPADPRVGAIAPISAVIDGSLQRDDRPSPNAGFTAPQLARVAVPVLLLGGTEDQNVPIENNAIAFTQLENAPRVVRVDLLGANHNHFAAICEIAAFLLDLGLGPEDWPGVGAAGLVEPYRTTCGPDAFPIEEAQRLQQLFVVAFFRATLRGEAIYERFLTPAYGAREPSATVAAR